MVPDIYSCLGRVTTCMLHMYRANEKSIPTLQLFSIFYRSVHLASIIINQGKSGSLLFCRFPFPRLVSRPASISLSMTKPRIPKTPGESRFYYLETTREGWLAWHSCRLDFAQFKILSKDNHEQLLEGRRLTSKQPLRSCRFLSD
jgi:hypothetical protein